MNLIELKSALRAGGWTLFLDRDGVINRRKIDGYILSPDEFHLLAGVREAVFEFSKWVLRILVVTNQRGIARGLMTETDLGAVHARMHMLFQEFGVSIDRVYYCPHDQNTGCACRKPGTGMPRQAKKDFPVINFSRSIMIGDTTSDLQMGRDLGMVCIHVGNQVIAPELYDIHLDSLKDFWVS